MLRSFPFARMAVAGIVSLTCFQHMAQADEKADTERRVKVAMALAVAKEKAKSVSVAKCSSDLDASRKEAIAKNVPLMIFVGTECRVPAETTAVAVKVPEYVGDFSKPAAPRVVILSKGSGIEGNGTDKESLYVRKTLPPDATPKAIVEATVAAKISSSGREMAPQPAIDWFPGGDDEDDEETFQIAWRPGLFGRNSAPAATCTGPNCPATATVTTTYVLVADPPKDAPATKTTPPPASKAAVPPLTATTVVPVTAVPVVRGDGGCGCGCPNCTGGTASAGASARGDGEKVRLGHRIAGAIRAIFGRRG